MNANIIYSDRMTLTATDKVSGVLFETNFENRYIQLDEALRAANDLIEFSCVTEAVIASSFTGEVLAICTPR